jgi:UDP-3-O-[3-hydroxymyristoyl] glucosamine N-acyltransferase
MVMNVRSLLGHIAHQGVRGDLDREITTILPLDPDNARADVLSWCSAKNQQVLPQVKAGAIICPLSAESMELSPDCTFIFCADPRAAYRDAFNALFPRKAHQAFRSQTAVVASSARIGDRVHIGHHVVIEEGCTIGDGCFIGHQTVLHENTVLGRNVSIGCNCTIGGMGFGYQPNVSGDYELMPHVGNVVIEDDVEIGNNTCVDRGALGSTRIRRNVKVDNLVHIAHNADIGENSLVIAHAMVAGSCEVGANAWIAPSAAILNKRKVGAGAMVGLGAVVVKDVEPGTTVAGNPARVLPKKGP